TLHLLRHAKSDWDDKSLTDHERPLAPRGVKAAHQLARHLEDSPIVVDLVICSTARRTRETLELIRQALGDVSVKFDDDLYAASTDKLLARLHRVPAKVGAVMLIGHNPGMEELAWLLLGPGRAPGDFPTAALASMTFAAADDWRSIREGAGKRIGFVTPKDL
nr:histidine phosphatase family protein [Candidatus Dormibacteraeota bacterium]